MLQLLVSCRKKSAPGLKKAKDHLTVLGYTNATRTHKLKPALIGKSEKPRCFKNVNMDALVASQFARRLFQSKPKVSLIEDKSQFNRRVNDYKNYSFASV